MTIRIIVRTDNANMAANVTGAIAETHFKTFLLEAPALELYLRAERKNQMAQCFITGIEELPI